MYAFFAILFATLAVGFIGLVAYRVFLKKQSGPIKIKLRK